MSMTALAAESSKETCGCEANPTGNPVGGGKGYKVIFASGDFEVRVKVRSGSNTMVCRNAYGPEKIQEE